MPRNRKTTDAKATAAVNTLFATAPQNRTKAQRLADVGDARAASKPTAAGKPATRRKSPADKAPAKDPQEQAAKSSSGRPDPSLELNMDDLPILDVPWMRIQERVFSLEDPEVEFDELEAGLKLTNALTPGNLEAALNEAEDNARRAHRMYVTARAGYECFEVEMTPVLEAMREAANRDLQQEKDLKQRSKAITDADLRGRASVLFPDEWALVMERKSNAEAMMDHLKLFADVWKQRCYSLSALVHAGKR